LNKKILIARGDRQAAKALSFLLAGNGYQIVARHTSQEAVATARAERFDLAIADGVLAQREGKLDLVTELKQAQPSLPVMLMMEESDLETIIQCIRSGVAEVVESSGDLRREASRARRFFEKGEAEGDDVSLDDLREVEEALARLLEAEQGKGGARSGPSLSEQLETSQKEVEGLRAEIDALAGKLEKEREERAKAEKVLKELEESDGGHTTESLEQQALLKERENEIEERARTIAKQKAEVEMQLAELEARQYEIEEAANAGVDSGEVAELKDCIARLESQVDDLQTRGNEMRVEYEKRIQNLTTRLEEAHAATEGGEAAKARLEELEEDLKETRKELSEKDFLNRQQAEQIAQLQADSQPHPEVEQLEEEKRLLEIEKFKLQEKVEELKEDTSKRQREIQVEKRDAEISLREMQNQVKEEQLKLHVELASFKEEKRQFDQARANFEEDVQDLQRRQLELRQYEERLKRLQEEVEASRLSKTLPQSAEKAAPSATEGADAANKKAPSLGQDPADQPSKASEDAKDPNSWSRPPVGKKIAGNRGPLRIGRRSSF